LICSRCPAAFTIAVASQLGAVLIGASPLMAQPVLEPPNVAAAVELTGGHLVLRYGDGVLVDATVDATGGAPHLRRFVDGAGGAVTQVLKWTAASGGQVTVTGSVYASPEAFAAEVEPRPEPLAVVRNSSGPAVNRLDRAVYDRRFDWVLSVDFPAQVEIVPAGTPGPGTSFTITASGHEVALRFRPRYYQRHRHLEQYRPWTYEPWRGSVAGWTSWYAFRDKVTEDDVRHTADVLGETLRGFGYRYLQIDDGYQQNPIGLASHWLETNPRFPHGLAALRSYIGDRGLDAGLWTNVAFADREAAESHPSWFVQTPDGRPAFGQWVGFVMDGSSPETIRSLIRPVYQAIRDMGWSYVKLDALRHLRYEGYNSFKEFFEGRGLDRAKVYRSVVETIRDILGPDTYLLACWGVRPELIGLVDGVRVGDDGFGYGAFAQYNSFNNVVWRNDPDHIEIGQSDGFRAATLASLTGSVLMLTDRPEVYRTDRVEAARRTAPVLFTRPGQLYDVDPSRSSRIAEADGQLSGAGPRPFDADKRLVVPLYQLDIARPFEQWTVLARTGGDDRPIDLQDLGLAPGADYVGFEFWTKTPLGVIRDRLRPPPIDPRFEVEAVCLRPRVDRPQVLATNRHVTCGGPDLIDVTWRDGVLGGTSELVAGDDYVLYLTEPAGFRLDDVSAEGATVASQAMDGATRSVRLRSASGGRVTWRIRYGDAPR
jgi:Melibiase